MQSWCSNQDDWFVSFVLHRLAMKTFLTWRSRCHNKCTIWLFMCVPVLELYLPVGQLPLTWHHGGSIGGSISSCHLSRKEPYTGEKLLVATACIVIDDDRFMPYTDKFKYLDSLLEKRIDDEVDANGRIKQAKCQFQMISILPSTYNFLSDPTLQCSYSQRGSIRMQ